MANAIHIDQAQLRAEIAKTKILLDAVPGKIGRRALRKAARQSGQYVLVQMRARAPKGQTGLFKRSLSKKAFTAAIRGLYMSIVGQKLSRAGGGEQARSSKGGFTKRQITVANNRNRGISTGISGTGKAAPIHFTSRRIKPHKISAVNNTKMYWNIGKGGVKHGLRSAVTVRHPGRPKVTDWVRRVRRRTRFKVVQIFTRAVNAEVLNILNKK